MLAPIKSKFLILSGKNNWTNQIFTYSRCPLSLCCFVLKFLRLIFRKMNINCQTDDRTKHNLYHDGVAPVHEHHFSSCITYAAHLKAVYPYC